MENSDERWKELNARGPNAREGLQIALDNIMEEFQIDEDDVRWLDPQHREEWSNLQSGRGGWAGNVRARIRRTKPTLGPLPEGMLESWQASKARRAARKAGYTATAATGGGQA